MCCQGKITSRIDYIRSPHCIWFQPTQNALGAEDTSLASSVPSASSDSLKSLSQKLNLVVPSSVKGCRIKGEALTNKAENDMISHSLIILQATVGRDRPTKSEFELCAKKIIALVPELKDPIPSINRSAFKQWVSTLIGNNIQKILCCCIFCCCTLPWQRLEFLKWVIPEKIHTPPTDGVVF